MVGTYDNREVNADEAGASVLCCGKEPWYMSTAAVSYRNERACAP